MLNVSAMKTNNPIIIGSALVANVGISAAKPVVSLAYVGGAALLAIASAARVYLPVLLKALLVAAIAVGMFAAKHVKCIALCVAVVGVVVAAFAMPQLALGALLVLVYAEVTKK